MTTNAIYEERGSDWSHQVSAMGTTRWLQRDQTLPLSCEARRVWLAKNLSGGGGGKVVGGHTTDGHINIHTH